LRLAISCAQALRRFQPKSRCSKADGRVRGASTREVRPPGAQEAERDITRIFNFLRGLVIADYEAALSHLDSPNDPAGQPWTADRLPLIMEQYHREHERLCLDPNARNVRHTYVTPSEDKKSWRVQQMLVDPQEHNDWVAEFEVDLAKSRALAEPVLLLRGIRVCSVF
jgi:hypothetical protein